MKRGGRPEAFARNIEKVSTRVIFAEVMPRHMKSLANDLLRNSLRSLSDDTRH